MADDQQAIVQRMIDAGESEENIATVIRHFQQSAAKPSTVSQPPTDGAVEGFVKGVAKSVLGTIEGGGKVIRSIPVVGDLLSRGPEITLPVSTQPSNTAQTVGKMAGDVAQFMAPGMGAGSRLVRGAKAAGLTYTQTGGDPVTSGISGAVTAALPAVGVAARTSDALQTSAHKSIAQALGATKEWAKTEAAKLAPQVLKRGIGGSRQAMLDLAESASKRVGGELNAAIDSAAKAGDTISGTAIRDGLGTIRDTFFVARPDGSRLAIPGTENVIRRLSSLDRFVSDLGAEIPVDKAVAVRRVWDQIVDEAGLFGRQGVSSGADNAGAFATKQASDAFRKLINESPSLEALNRESSFWQGLQGVLKETLHRTQAQSGGLSQAVQGTVGAAAGYSVGDSGWDRTRNAVMGGLASRQVVRLMQSPTWGTKVSAPLKSSLSSALASGSAARVESISRAIIQSLPAQLRPKATETEPVSGVSR